QALTEEKATLVKALKSNGTAILNMDDPRVFAMRHLTAAPIITFGSVDGAEVRLIRVQVLTEENEYGRVPTGLEIQLESLNRLRTLQIQGVFGTPIAFAVAAAVTVGVALDLGLDPIQDLPNHFHPLPGRTRMISGIKHTTLLDDTYNASPAAVISAIRDLATMPLLESQRRIVCLGEMRELGDQSQGMHRLVGAEAAKQGIDFFVACGTLAPAMVDGALANGMKEEQIKIFDDTPEAAEFLREWIRPGDVILAKASEGQLDSKGVRMERVIKALMLEPQRASELLVRQEAVWKRR
ncbi:MAG: cyanophycin synthetase, partial [Candidatus Uhrbacteria bacterium]|nr:cyanophycin synthetase [Candidatus Uhrbacteria bacterium]